MLFTIKRPTSKRFFQLSLGGFSPDGRNLIEQFIKTWAQFLLALYKYIWKKLKLLFGLLSRVLYVIFSSPIYFKSFLTKKLIWSRGRLGRSIATTVVLGITFGVFMIGEIFSSSTLVVAQPVNPDYLSSVTDIIPKKEMALTTLPEERRRSEAYQYTVEGGDTLYSIGSKFKTSVDALEYVNNLSDNAVLKVGQQITIPPISGLVHKVSSGDTLNSIANKYDVPAQSIADFNYLLDTSKLAVGTELVIPGAKVPQIVAPPVITTSLAAVGTSQAAPNKKFCVWPTTVRIITQNFSWYHNGVDIATPLSGGMPPLLACASGTVTRAGWDPFGLGLHIRIDHGNGFETIYGHMSRLDVSYGEKVSQGEILGLMGSTGNSTGPHVHFMVRYHGVAQNPISYTN